jgi:hypothetical protein
VGELMATKYMSLIEECELAMQAAESPLSKASRNLKDFLLEHAHSSPLPELQESFAREQSGLEVELNAAWRTLNQKVRCAVVGNRWAHFQFYSQGTRKLLPGTQFNGPGQKSGSGKCRWLNDRLEVCQRPSVPKARAETLSNWFV